METIRFWLAGLPQVVQVVVWGLAMFLAAACCGTKARPVYHGGR